MAGGLKKLKFHYKGFDQFRKQPALTDDLDARGHRIAARAGGEPDFMVESEPNASRARTVVFTATVDAMRAEATERALTNSLDAGRG